MKSLKHLLDKARPAFEPGGRLSALGSVFDGFDTFLFTPRTTSGPSSVHVHDAIDSKRTMIVVVAALMPCFFFGMYNTGYQHWLALGATEFHFWQLMLYGLLAVLPRVIVTYFVGLGIEFAFAQWRKEEIQEGFLVTGILIPMICPIETPLWMLAVATAFAVVFAKEVFGGTGYNIVNVALVARAFLFFAYPAQMSGDKVFVASGTAFGYGMPVADGFTCATPLGQIATHSEGALTLTGIDGHVLTAWDAFVGLIPGSFGETSVLCILIGAAILLFSGMANWRIMLGVFGGGLVMGWIANAFATPTYPASLLPAWEQLLYGGFSLPGGVIAPDPRTGARPTTRERVYGGLLPVAAVFLPGVKDRGLPCLISYSCLPRT